MVIARKFPSSQFYSLKSKSISGLCFNCPAFEFSRAVRKWRHNFPLLSYKDCLYCPVCRRQIRPEILKPSVCCCTMVSSFQTSLIIKLKNITNSFTKSVQTFIKNVEKRNISSKCNLTFINIAKLPYWLSIWFYPRKEIISGRF